MLKLPGHKMRELKHLEDAEYISEVDAAAIRGAHRHAHVILFTIAAFFVAFLIWASQAEVESVTRGQGKVVPSSNIQTIQNLEGGILSEVLVTEGDIVDKNQTLIRVDNKTAEADFKDLQQRSYRLQAEIARLEAEVNGDNIVSFPEDVVTNASDVVERERQLFLRKKNQFQSNVNILQNQIDQKTQELRSIRSNASSIQSTLELAREELEINRPLADQGLVPRTDFLRLQREVNDLESQLSTAKLQIPVAQGAISEARGRLEESEQARIAESQQILNEKQAELSSVSQMTTAREDRVTRTELRSPVRGEIQEIMVNTIGGVIKPGEDLISIVPIDDNLVIEADIRPQDVSHIHVDQDAVIKITAYDFTTWGGLNGKVRNISADTFENEKGERFYRVRIETEKNYIGDGVEIKKDIIPGMVAQVDILSSEKKSILTYILKPFLRAKQNAMREY